MISKLLFRSVRHPLFRGHIFRRNLSTENEYKWSYVSGSASQPLIGLTLGQLLEKSASEYGDREAVVCRHQGPLRKCFGQVLEDADQLAAGLLDVGLQPGDRLGIWGPNSYEWYMTQMASARAGLVLVNVNPAYQSQELEYCINKVGIKALVTARMFKTQNYYDILNKLVDLRQLKSNSQTCLKHVIMMNNDDNNRDKLEGTHCLDEVFQAGKGSGTRDIASLQSMILMDDPCNIQFTSGTTGHPKGACLSHHNVVNNARFIGMRLGYDLKHHKVCLNVPLYHTFGCVIGNVCGLVHGITTVMPGPHFNPQECLEAVEAEKCTSIYGTPTMFTDVIAAANKNSSMKFKSVETGIMAGSPCPEKLCKQVIEELNMTNFVVCYGMTETSPVTFQGFPHDEHELRTTTIGFPAAHTEVKVVDDSGRLVPVGTPGELCTRGYSTMLGYWNDRVKTEEIIGSDRWLHTGDVAVILPNGYGQIVGRIKDIVIRGGENLYPREIEEVLHHHPSVQEAHVVGVPDARMGEELCAWIKTTQDTTLEAQEIKEFCKSQLAHFKVPKYIMFVNEFPTTVTGKIQKFRMREESIRLLHLEQ